MNNQHGFTCGAKILTIVFSAALIVFTLGTTDYDLFWFSLAHADIGWFISLAIVFTLAHLTLDSLAVGLLLDRTGVGLPLLKLIPIRAASYMLGMVNYNLAFVMIAIAAGRDRRVHWQSLASPFLALNMFDLALMGVFLIAGLIPGETPEMPGAFPVMLAIGLCAVGLLIGVLTVSRFRRLRLKGFPAGFMDTFNALKVRTILLVLFLRSALLLLDATGDILMMRTFNLVIPLDVFARFFPIDSLACALPIALGGIGPTLVLMRLFFAPYSPASNGSVAAIDAFSVSATTILVLTQVALSVIFLPWVSNYLKVNSETSAPDRNVQTGN